MHVLALFASIANSLPVDIKLLIVLAVISSYWFIWQRYMNASYPYTLLYNDARGWELMDAKQQVYPVSIGGSSVTTPAIIILHLQLEDRTRRVMIIVRDAVSEEDFRQLRVQLKISRLN